MDSIAKYGPITENGVIRKSGQTTRIVDRAIQFLFKDGFCIVKDHIDTQQAVDRLLDIVEKRLKVEHKGVKYNIKPLKNSIGYKLYLI